MLMIRTLIPLVCCLFMQPAMAENKASLIYGAPANEHEKVILQDLKKADTAGEVITLINEKFKLPEPFQIIFGGKDGPLYDPETNEVLILYGFIDEVKKRFIKAKYASTGVTPEQATDDALMHTLFHELGQETVISAADLFDLESDDLETLEEADFWDEHSLDAQRYYSSLCHVYGSNPEKYSAILDNTDISGDRAELCIEEYETLRRGWFKLLKLKH